MPSRLVLPGGGARSRRCSLISRAGGVREYLRGRSLFRAGIRPDAQLVSADRLKRLHAALREVLLESIDACGSSIRDYRTARGDAGAFQNAFRVYGRSGETCLSVGPRWKAAASRGGPPFLPELSACLTFVHTTLLLDRKD